MNKKEGGWFIFLVSFIFLVIDFFFWIKNNNNKIFINKLIWFKLEKWKWCVEKYLYLKENYISLFFFLIVLFVCWKFGFVNK